MGLDITAYSQLRRVPDAALDDSGYPVEDYHIMLAPSVLQGTIAEFPGRAEDLTSFTGALAYSDAHGFRAGSYSGYNAWRDELAKFAGYGSAEAVWADPGAEGPFVELINFADNEGYIGPKASAKLLKDFEEHLDRLVAYQPSVTDAPWWREKYLDWLRAFRFAADGGVVDFH